jgi:hypothetical protein
MEERNKQRQFVEGPERENWWGEGELMCCKPHGSGTQVSSMSMLVVSGSCESRCVRSRERGEMGSGMAQSMKLTCSYETNAGSSVGLDTRASRTRFQSDEPREVELALRAS